MGFFSLNRHKSAEIFVVNSIMDIRSLFKIVGEEGHLLTQVKSAMEWLLSPTAEGIGEKLLRDAHALHGKPLTVIVSETLENAYHTAKHAHIIVINPKIIEKLGIRTAEGTLHAASMERVLAHELVHAGQTFDKDILMQAFISQIELAVKTEAKGMSAQEEAIWNMANSAYKRGDKAAAKMHFRKWANAIPQAEIEEATRKFNAALSKDEHFSKMVEAYETQAVEVENRVAHIKGEAQRHGYINGMEVIKPEFVRELMADGQLGMLEAFDMLNHLTPAQEQEIKGAMSDYDQARAARRSAEQRINKSPNNPLALV